MKSATIAALRSKAAFFTAGVIALSGAACAASLQADAPRDPAGRATDPKGHAAESAQARANDDLSACANVRDPALSAPGHGSVAHLARLLHGTWVRRLTIAGVAVETNSFLYFDMSGPEAGKGEALMIDLINQGWDGLASPAASLPGKRQAEPAQAAEARMPATTGAYWVVSMKPAAPAAASRGRSGVALALAGDYRGTGAEYPPNGFRFTETGSFYGDGPGYSTVQPWRAPPMALEAAPTTQPAQSAEAFTPIDLVAVRPGTVDPAGNRIGPRAPTSEGQWEMALPRLTYVVCEGEIVDRYFKIDSATPTVGGKSLKAAWHSALETGLFSRGRFN
ncbi:MAG TPA: hypothetical protein VF589_07295 [Allosphingosinicella sp.]